MAIWISFFAKFLLEYLPISLLGANRLLTDLQEFFAGYNTAVISRHGHAF